MGGLGGDTPSFDGLLDSSHPKDTEVIIAEEASPQPAAQGCAAGTEEEHCTDSSSINLAAHWVVLWGLSPYFRAKLDRWSSDQSVDGEAQEQDDCQQQQDVVKKKKKKKKKTRDQAQQQPQQQQQQQDQQQQHYQYSLQLLVPPGQLELGRRLITAMYSSSPDLSDLEAPQLMQLVELAECYGVGKVVTAAAQQLQQLSVEGMPLATAIAVFELPEACLGLEAFSNVRATAVDKLQQELGDLEVVWGDKDKQQALMGLPLAALLMLVADHRTRVASEDTVVYTAGRWLEEQLQPLSRQQQLQLVYMLRLPHCTPSYLASVVAPADSWLRKAGLTEKEALALCTLPAPGTGQRAWRLKNVWGHSANWQLPARPASSIKVLHVQRKLPLSTLEDALSNTSPVTQPNESLVTWYGRRWGMNIDLCSQGLGLYLTVHQVPVGVDAKYSVIAFGGSWVSRSLAGVYIESGDCWGWDDMLNWGAGKDWPQVQEWLQQQKLVQPDGCLHLRIAITQVC